MGWPLATGNARVIVDLIIVLTTMSIVLIAAVIAFKFSRDRLERNSAALQARITTAWEGSDSNAMLAVAQSIARGGVHAQSDLTVVCNRTAGAPWWTPERVEAVQRSFIEAGLADRLRSQLTSRSNIRRGLALYLAGFPCWPVAPGGRRVLHTGPRTNHPHGCGRRLGTYGDASSSGRPHHSPRAESSCAFARH